MKLKRAVRVIIMCLCVFFGIQGMQKILIPFSSHDTNQNRTFYEQPDNTIDVLAVGTSLMMMGFSPLRMYDKTGITAYNRASSCQAPQITYFTVKKTLKTQKLKAVICSATVLTIKFNYDKKEAWLRRGMDYKKFSADKIKIAKDLASRSKEQSLASYIFPILRYHSRWTDVFKGELTDERDGEYDYNRGYTPIYGHLERPNVAARNLANREKIIISDDTKYWMGKTIQLCKENNVKFIIIGNMTMQWTKGMHNATKDYADKMNVDFYDYNFSPYQEECGLDWEKDFYDRKHTNIFGVFKLTDDIGKILVEKYKIGKSKLPEKVKAQYREDIKRLMQKYQEALNGKTDNKITWE